MLSDGHPAASEVKCVAGGAGGNGLDSRDLWKTLILGYEAKSGQIHLSLLSDRLRQSDTCQADHRGQQETHCGWLCQRLMAFLKQARNAAGTAVVHIAARLGELISKA